MGITATQKKKLTKRLRSVFRFKHAEAKAIMDRLEIQMVREGVPYDSDIYLGYVDADLSPNNDMDDTSATLAFTARVLGKDVLIGYPNIMIR